MDFLAFYSIIIFEVLTLEITHFSSSLCFSGKPKKQEATPDWLPLFQGQRRRAKGRSSELGQDLQSNKAGQEVPHEGLPPPPQDTTSPVLIASYI
jgi:hypothetical protein